MLLCHIHRVETTDHFFLLLLLVSSKIRNTKIKPQTNNLSLIVFVVRCCRSQSSVYERRMWHLQNVSQAFLCKINYIVLIQNTEGARCHKSKSDRGRLYTVEKVNLKKVKKKTKTFYHQISLIV